MSRLIYHEGFYLAADLAIRQALFVIAVTFFFIILIAGISPIFSNATADAALLVFGNFAFTHVTPPDALVIFTGKLNSSH